MSSSVETLSPPPASVADFVRLGNHRLAAQQMLRHLGAMAAACAIDRQAQARMCRNTTECSFWSLVCHEIIALQTGTPVLTH